MYLSLLPKTGLIANSIGSTNLTACDKPAEFSVPISTFSLSIIGAGNHCDSYGLLINHDVTLVLERFCFSAPGCSHISMCDRNNTIL